MKRFYRFSKVNLLSVFIYCFGITGIPCNLYAQDSFIITRGWLDMDTERMGLHDLSNPGSPPTIVGWGHSVYAAVSWDGLKKIYIKHNPRGFHMSNIDDTDEQLVYSFAAGDWLPSMEAFALSPDGNMIAYIEGTTFNIILIDLQEQSRRVIVPQSQAPFTIGLNNRQWPRWSSDGTKLVYQVPTSETVSLHMVDVFGDQPPVKITFPEVELPSSRDGDFDWLPNSSRVIFNRRLTMSEGSAATVRSIIYEMDMNDENLTKRVIYDQTLPVGDHQQHPHSLRWSPSGDQIAARRVVGEEIGMYAMNSSDGGFTLLYQVPRVRGNYLVSQIDRWTSPLPEPKIQVNSTTDRPNLLGRTNCNTGETVDVDGEEVPECTLRAALEAAAARGGENPITFNIPGSGPHTISLQSMLPDVPAQTILDATTQPNYNGTPLIAINGSNAIASALNITQGQTVVKGFSVGGFTGAGIAISGPGQNMVEGCYIGVAPNGVIPTPNEAGVLIINSKENTIGGEEPESRNVISGNLLAGVVISGEASTENHVFGNYIGTSSNGNEALPNGGHGILLENAPANLIGGVAATHRNLISGNLGSGIVVSGTDATENQVLGNYIGVNGQGSEPLGNELHGILIEEGAAQSIIGGSTSTTGMPPGNVISGNSADGIKMKALDDQASPKNKISGNIIGLNAAGNAAVANGGRGIQVTGRVKELEIGGPTRGFGNLVSGHAETQIELLDEENEVTPSAPIIANNTIGVSITGNSVFTPISKHGIVIGNTGRLIAEIGVPDIRMEDNLVAGNEFNILIMGELTGNSEISGNTIGLLRNGNIAVADSAVIGLWILGGKDMQIGRKEKPNVIGGHTIGLFLAGDHNRVSGNRIGTNEAGTQARPNQIGLFIPGVYKQFGQTVISPTGFRNFIGLELDDEGEIQEGGNIISGNKLKGIAIVPEFGGDALKSGSAVHDKILNDIKIPDFNFKAIETDLLKNNSFSPADSNIIAGNLIGLSASEGPLGNGKSNIDDERGGGIEITRGRGNYIIHNKIGDNGVGIAVYRDPEFLHGPGNTYISGNDIGTRLRDTILTPRPNQSSGIVHLSSSHLYIGTNPNDPLMQFPNVIAQNGQHGVLIRRYSNSDAGESNVTLRGNFMAANKELAYIVGVDADQTGGDVPGVPFPPELLLITVDSARVTIAGKALQTGEVDLYTGKPDHYGENAISTRHYKKTITLEGAAEFQLNESLDTLSFKEGEYVSATLNVSPVDEFFMTSHFSPAIRVAKKENTIIKAVEDSEIGELINGWGIEISREENSEKSSQIKEGRSGTLYLAFHNLAPEFNTFTGQVLSPDGETLIKPDTRLLYHYWTLTTDALYTNDYKVCITLPTNKSNLDINDMVLVQRYRTGAPWYALETFAGSQPGTLCARGLYPTGDFSLGFHAGISTNTYAPVFSQKDRVLYNYPNPFRHETTITLNLTMDGETFVRLLDVQGRLIKEIFNGHLHQGEHKINLSVEELPPGIYIIQAGNEMERYMHKVMVGR